jgi:hypothetical protein
MARCSQDHFAARLFVTTIDPMKLILMALLMCSFTATAEDEGPKTHTWAAGVSAAFADFSQSGRTFTTSDGSQWATTSYNSTSLIPSLAIQLDPQNFWRLHLAYFSTHFTATANNNVGGAAMPLSLSHNFISAQLEHAWSVFPWKEGYIGLGVEADKAVSVDLTLGGQPLPTTSQNEPIYLGPYIMLGAEWPLDANLTFFAEARAGAMVNQSPLIAVFQGAVGLLYWP